MRAINACLLCLNVCARAIVQNATYLPPKQIGQTCLPGGKTALLHLVLQLPSLRHSQRAKTLRSFATRSGSPPWFNCLTQVRCVRSFTVQCLSVVLRHAPGRQPLSWRRIEDIDSRHRLLDAALCWDADWSLGQDTVLIRSSLCSSQQHSDALACSGFFSMA